MISVMNTQTCSQPSDWHPADVLASLKKRGTSLRRVGIEHGYKQVQNVLVRPWWAVEQIVAQALGVPAEQIWPSRYTEGSSRQHAQRLTRNTKALKAIRRSARREQQ